MLLKVLLFSVETIISKQINTKYILLKQLIGGSLSQVSQYNPESSFFAMLGCLLPGI